MNIPRMLLAGLLAVVGLGVAPGKALAATPPVIQGTHEVGIPEGGGRMLLVYGTNLTKVTAWELDEADGTLIAPLVVVFKGKTLTGLALPASFSPSSYTLPGDYSLKYVTKLATASVLVRLTGGRVEDGGVSASSLDPALATDLADAATVGGESPASLHDAGLLTGTLATSAFSAYDDLVDEGAVGAGSSQVAAGNHNHDTAYPLRTELNTTGTVNAPANPVEWSRIKGIPAGIADGVDDTSASSYTAGTGLNLTGSTFSVVFGSTGTTVAAGNHNHDTSYYTQTQLNAAGGTVNAGGNPVDWSRLKSVPPGFADGTDADTTYTNGTGLTLTGTTFSVTFGTTSTTVAAGNHTHSGYLATSGGTLTGTLTINATSAQAIVATSGSTSTKSGGIDSVTAGGIAVHGNGNIGVLGDLDSDGTWGVAGKAGYSYQVGVYAYANSGQYDSTSMALYAYHFWYGTGIKAKSYGGTALYAMSYSGYAVYARMPGSYRTAVRVTASGNYATGVSSYAGQYGTGIYAGVGYRGTSLRTNMGYNGTGVYVYVRGGKSTGLLVNGYYTRNLAVFQRYGSNYARIDSAGRGYFNGGTYSSGADFAESVRVDGPVEDFEPGDVMVIDPNAPRQFALSREAGSRLVAGVISTKPALVGSIHDVAKGRNNRMREEVKLGIVGIVPTKVCDEGGPIRIGDLLVTSSTPGHAMKAPSNPAVGTVVGKALGALDRGTGKIEILLMAR